MVRKETYFILEQDSYIIKLKSSYIELGRIFETIVCCKKLNVRIPLTPRGFSLLGSQPLM